MDSKSGLSVGIATIASAVETRLCERAVVVVETSPFGDIKVAVAE
jgi:hypothetical protein